MASIGKLLKGCLVPRQGVEERFFCFGKSPISADTAHLTCLLPNLSKKILLPFSFSMEQPKEEVCHGGVDITQLAGYNVVMVPLGLGPSRALLVRYS